MKRRLAGIILVLLILSLVGGAAVAQGPTYVKPPEGHEWPAIFDMPRLPLSLPKEQVCPAPDENWIRANIIVRDEDKGYKQLNLDLCPTTGKLQALVPELIKPYDQLWWFSMNPEVATVARHELPDAGYDSTATVRPVTTGITCVYVVVRHEHRIYYDFARVLVSQCAEDTLTGSETASAGTDSAAANVAGETIAAAEGSQEAAVGETAVAGASNSLVYAGTAIGLLMIFALLFARKRQSTD